jgi:hypothetical protein
MMENRTIICVDPAWRAPWYRRLLARIFGRKFLGHDGTTTVIALLYDGKFYIREVKHD